MLRIFVWAALIVGVLGQSSNAQNQIPQIFPEIFRQLQSRYPTPPPYPDDRATGQFVDQADLIKQVQEALVWEGLYPGPLDGELGARTLAAIKRFQKTINGSQDGRITDLQFAVLKERASRKAAAISFATVLDPQNGVELGVPLALLPTKASTPFGQTYSSRDEAIVVGVRAAKTRESIAQNFEAVRSSFTNAKFDYTVIRDDWFVVAGEVGSVKFYVRYYQAVDNLAGFFAVYRKDGTDFATPLSMMSLTLRPFARNGFSSLRLGVKLNEPADLVREKAALEDTGAQPFGVAAGSPPIYWRMNDTIVRLVSDNNARSFLVERPSLEARRAEMLAGSLVFKGVRNGNSYSGAAVSYQAGCSPLQYQISGSIAPNDERVDLRGPTPVRDGSCRIVSYKEAAISFELIKPEQPLSPAPVSVSSLSAPTIIEKIPNKTESLDANSSKLLLDSVEELLSKSNSAGARYFKYVVDRTTLDGFREDMPVLRIVFPEQVFFDTDKASLRAETTTLVATLASTIKSRSATGQVAVFVAGHTDARGTDDYNLGLSYKRADSVARALSGQDVGNATLWRVGFGKAVPIKPNDGPRNWAFNRRVEFLLASQPSIIAAWIKSTKSLCEESKVDCGGLTANASFRVEPIGRDDLQAISVEVPARPVIVSKATTPTERLPLPFDIPERPSLFVQ